MDHFERNCNDVKIGSFWKEFAFDIPSFDILGADILLERTLSNGQKRYFVVRFLKGYTMTTYTLLCNFNKGLSGNKSLIRKMLLVAKCIKS